MGQLTTLTCSHCAGQIAAIAAVYGDHNRRYCSDACARAQLDGETGVASRGQTNYASRSPGRTEATRIASAPPSLER